MAYVPIEWLGQHVEIAPDLDAKTLAKALVKVGLEEETIHSPAVTGPLVVGKVLSKTVEKQKNGKIISYCRVDVGTYNDEPGTGAEPSDIASRGIICGAQNFVAGDWVVVALPEAVLPGGFAIAARKTYGHISDGMMCSTVELGMNEHSNGIIILTDMFPNAQMGQDDFIPGADAKTLLGISGEILEINITPDRGYCFSMRGVAREYALSTGAKFTDLGLAENAFSKPLPVATPNGFEVRVQDDKPIHGQIGCDHFVTRVVRGFDPSAPSPKWLQKCLREAGMRSISLAVDVTNFVMLDLGQPIHAYDLDKVVAPLVVRRAKADETITTLDEVTRTLDEEDLIITDSDGGIGQRPLSLAGVMGGSSTEIDDDTVNILVEAAHFDPITVARTARRHKIPTESAKRNERGVDPQLPAVAAQKCVDLLVQYGGGTITDEVSIFDVRKEAITVDFALDIPAKLVGIDYPPEVVIQILEQIGAKVGPVENGKVKVEIPSWRPDLEPGGAHLVEEIARVYGYEQIPVQSPRALVGAGLPIVQRKRRDVARNIAENGWTQVLNYPFIGTVHDDLGYSVHDYRNHKIRLANPLAEDTPYLRTSLLDTLLGCAKRNLARQSGTVAIYEVDSVFQPHNIVTADNPGAGSKPSTADLEALYAATPYQPLHVAGVAVGAQYIDNALGKSRVWDWADAVCDAVASLSTIGLSVEVKQADMLPWHPGRCAALVVLDHNTGTNYTLGYAGQLDPKVAKKVGLPAETVAFEYNLSQAIDLIDASPIRVKPVSTFPVAKEDFAFVVDKALPAQQLVAVISKAAGEIIQSVTLFDVYESEQLGADKKSLAIALQLRSIDHTLSAEEINLVRKTIISSAQTECNAQLRA